MILIKKRLFLSGECKRDPQNRDRRHTQKTRFRLLRIITDDYIWSRWKPVTAPVSCLYLQVWFCHTKMSQKLSQTHKRCVFWFLVNPFLLLNSSRKMGELPSFTDKNPAFDKKWVVDEPLGKKGSAPEVRLLQMYAQWPHPRQRQAMARWAPR